MKVIKKKKIEQDILTDIICDCCDKSCLDSHKLNYEFAHLTANWGYYSHRDTESWECYLCEECAVKIKEFIENLGGKIQISYYMQEETKCQKAKEHPTLSLMESSMS